MKMNPDIGVVFDISAAQPLRKAGAKGYEIRGIADDFTRLAKDQGFSIFIQPEQSGPEIAAKHQYMALRIAAISGELPSVHQTVDILQKVTERGFHVAAPGAWGERPTADLYRVCPLIREAATVHVDPRPAQA
jgi:hypothetical protein